MSATLWTRRAGALLASVGLLMSLVVLMASPAEADHPGPIPHSSEANQTAFWVDFGSEHEEVWVCVKHEPVSDPFVVPVAPEGRVWRLLVIKGGSGDDANQLFWDPVAGNSYSHSSTGNSHVILCHMEEPTEEETTTVPEETTTVPEETTTVPEETTTVPEETTTTVEDEVLGTTVTTAPTSTVADEVLGTTVETLPFTGAETSNLLVWGIWLTGLGLLVVAATRRGLES